MSTGALAFEQAKAERLAALTDAERSCQHHYTASRGAWTDSAAYWHEGEADFYADMVHSIRQSSPFDYVGVTNG